MKIVIDNTEYTEIVNLSFAPETNMTATEIPVNRFIAEIKTSDTLSLGTEAYLYDDNDNLWAKYWLTSAIRND